MLFSASQWYLVSIYIIFYKNRYSNFLFDIIIRYNGHRWQESYQFISEIVKKVFEIVYRKTDNLWSIGYVVSMPVSRDFYVIWYASYFNWSFYINTMVILLLYSYITYDNTTLYWINVWLVHKIHQFKQ